MVPPDRLLNTRMPKIMRMIAEPTTKPFRGARKVIGDLPGPAGQWFVLQTSGTLASDAK
jgi:hypothetical protein